MTVNSSYILLNPGPVNISVGVRQALTQPDLCHREPEFSHLQDTIRQKLLKVYSLSSETWAPVLLAGSGTAAVEAMLVSIVPQQGEVLVLENGVYGERMTRICEIHNISHRVITCEWGEPIDIPAVLHELEYAESITHVAVVHHETTTGRLNDISTLGELCQSKGIQLLVDAVSSFGAEAIDFELLGACAATANKCLHGVPGVSFVMVRRNLLFTNTVKPRSLYLDLAAYCRAQETQTTPFTQPVHVYYAFDRALSELANQGGWEMRRQHYKTLALQVREEFTRLGIVPLFEEGDSSVVLNAYRVPESIDYDTLHDRLKAQGIVIYGGQGQLARNIFRISTMGAITRQDIDRLLFAFREILEKSKD